VYSLTLRALNPDLIGNEDGLVEVLLGVWASDRNPEVEVLFGRNDRLWAAVDGLVKLLLGEDSEIPLFKRAFLNKTWVLGNDSKGISFDGEVDM